jgi:hypothetical protein
MKIKKNWKFVDLFERYGENYKFPESFGPLSVHYAYFCPWNIFNNIMSKDFCWTKQHTFELKKISWVVILF